jgi:carboxymethylenebutenolidase
MCHDDCPNPVRGGAPLQELSVEIPLDAGSIPAFVALPDAIDSAAGAPAILLIHDINGPNDFYRDIARRLATEGYITAMPDFFFRQGPKPETRELIRARAGQMSQTDTLADIRSALHWLRDHEASSGEVGTIGFCMGGTLVMLASSRHPLPAASVVFYGFPYRERTPMAPIMAGDDAEAAGVESPLLGFWGDGDAGVGMDNVAKYDDLLTRYQKDHAFVIYPGVGHGFVTFDPDAPAYDATQRAWAQTLTFLGERLGRSGTSSARA